MREDCWELLSLLGRLGDGGRNNLEIRHSERSEESGPSYAKGLGPSSASLLRATGGGEGPEEWEGRGSGGGGEVAEELVGEGEEAGEGEGVEGAGGEVEEEPAAVEGEGEVRGEEAADVGVGE